MLLASSPSVSYTLAKRTDRISLYCAKIATIGAKIRATWILVTPKFIFQPIYLPLHLVNLASRLSLPIARLIKTQRRRLWLIISRYTGMRSWALRGLLLQLFSCLESSSKRLSICDGIGSAEAAAIVGGLGETVWVINFWNIASI